MSDSNFTPKLGRIRDHGRAHPIRHAKRVIGEAAKVRPRPLRFGGHIGPNALRRGLAQGTVSASGLFVPGSRRVIVRARYTRQKAGEFGVQWVRNKWQDFVDGVQKGGASAICTTNIYHFTESSIQSAKKYLNNASVLVRN